ncbi:hypothetical protein BGZ70_007476 [Mortierella alpina]|uniref:tRNA-uridine aminocarboxypropyltransferase n=1 Tax=Mortierella alpina TaxID=64518 RepID=A0A9P6J609_MORAP|nr:hypothetical protein BGZ70_007476 [Mortierella alpina]
MSKAPIHLSDLPDDILLRVFSFFVSIQETEAHSGQNDLILTPSMGPMEDTSTSALPPSTIPTTKGPKSTKKQKAKKGNRVAGLGARTLCRLCCCSRRFNHLASADQLWQPLTLTRFPDRHWPTTDQKNLELIKVRREHQLKLQQPSVDLDSRTTESGRLAREGGSAMEQGQDDSVQEDQDIDGGQHKKQKRTKFYSRFEQRAHRRRFANLDPQLKYTPLAWTNTFWNWKRTFFGDCRFVESKDVQTPNRIELDQALEDPNCTPLLLYPSHSAVDIHTLAPSARAEQSQQSSRYHCQECIHADRDLSIQKTEAPPSPSTYPYKLIIALDGSWSHAKIMYRCNPRLQQLTQIKFPNPPQSIYHELKPEPKTTYTSTAEAVGQAVALLGWPSLCAEEGSPSDAELLLDDLIRPLKKMIEIQDTIAQEQQSTPDQDGDTTV